MGRLVLLDSGPLGLASGRPGDSAGEGGNMADFLVYGSPSSPTFKPDDREPIGELTTSLDVALRGDVLVGDFWGVEREMTAAEAIAQAQPDDRPDFFYRFPLRRSKR